MKKALCHTTAEWEDFGVHEAQAWSSTEFYCHTCERVWGRIECFNHGSHFAHLACQDHQDERSEFYPPGSMLDEVESAGLLSAMPEAFIRREFWLHLTWAELQTEVAR